MKKYVDISGFNINQANRGNAALSYGAVSFLMEKGLLHEGQEFVFFLVYKNLFKKEYHRQSCKKYKVNGVEWKYNIIFVSWIELLLAKVGIRLPFTTFGKTIKEVEYEAADYGGDGLSDIYGDSLFHNRMSQTRILKTANVPLLILPMTIGPFKKNINKKIAHEIIKYASKVYVRDDRYTDELKSMGISFERSNDLSAYMLPEQWNIEIPDNAVGINVSGLAYSNGFGNLVGQFDAYPELIDKLIRHFRDKGHIVYLIPHSYNYIQPEENNDDMIACRDAYDRLQDKSNVIFLDKDLTSPRVKYVISKMKFFIGTRMHANFAAIYTNIPLFGLAYSYKFVGAFNANGLNGEKQTAMINNLKSEDIPALINKINDCYTELVK